MKRIIVNLGAILLLGTFCIVFHPFAPNSVGASSTIEQSAQGRDNEKHCESACESEKTQQNHSDPANHNEKARTCGSGIEDGHDDHGANGGMCPEHGIPEIEDALCRPEAIGQLLPGEGLRVRLKDADAGENAGVSVASPREIPRAGGPVFPGTTEFNRSRFARITPPVDGIVQEVMVTPGDSVEKGAVLAKIASPELSGLKADLLTAEARQSQARSAYLREKDLLARGISSRQEYQAAEADYKAARSLADQYRRQLQDIGLLPQAIDAFLNSEKNHSTLPVTAPFAGQLSEINAAPGEFVEPGNHLFTVADLDHLWIALAVPESRIFQAETGGLIQAEFDGLPGKTFAGRIFQVGAAIDSQSRTLRVLAKVDNPGHLLKAGMYGRVRMLSDTRETAVGVPADAVQNIDGHPFLFVRVSDDLFEVRRIEQGKAANGLVPVLSGLGSDEEIVTAQAFALKSEVLKARLGASCADH